MKEATGRGGVRVVLPRTKTDPVVAVAKRFGFAVLLICFVAVLVRFDHHGYKDAKGDGISLLDSFYYATVSVTTTGYGDIVPVTNGARILASSVVTVIRVVFLIMLVGTTIEVATKQGRHAISLRRWRKKLKQHVIVCGYGTKGRAAVDTLLVQGCNTDDIVVIDNRHQVIEEATNRGLTGVVGDATRTDVLREAGIERARAVVVAPNDDADAVLTTLTARELNASASISASAREAENAHLLRQGGADSVIVSSAASGRLLGMSTHAPKVVEVLEDLLTAGSGLEIYQRPVTAAEVGAGPAVGDGELVVAVLRDSSVIHARDIERLNRGDELVVLQSARVAGTA